MKLLDALWREDTSKVYINSHAEKLRIIADAGWILERNGWGADGVRKDPTDLQAGPDGTQAEL